MKIKYVCLVWMVLMAPCKLFAQNVSLVDSAGKFDLIILKKIILKNYEMDHAISEDTTHAYSFAVKLSIAKRPQGKVMVDKIAVNDSIAYGFFKDFDFFKTIDFSPFLREKKEAEIIIPMAIVIYHGINRNDDAGLSLFQRVFDPYIERLFFTDNIGEGMMIPPPNVTYVRPFILYVSGIPNLTSLPKNEEKQMRMAGRSCEIIR